MKKLSFSHRNLMEKVPVPILPPTVGLGAFFDLPRSQNAPHNLPNSTNNLLKGGDTLWVLRLLVVTTTPDTGYMQNSIKNKSFDIVFTFPLFPIWVWRRSDLQTTIVHGFIGCQL